MPKDDDREIDFEGELNLSHALLDIAGPKPLAGLISSARLGYENAQFWIGTVRDPTKLRRLTAKLDRLRERLSKCTLESPSGAPVVAIKTVP